jgi:hypothetical protein
MVNPRPYHMTSRAVAKLLAERQDRDNFVAAGSVTLTRLDPGHPDHQAVIDEASIWALDPARRGRSRRIIDAEGHRATWAFESDADAVEFGLIF